MKFRISVLLLFILVTICFFLRADWWLFLFLIFVFCLITFLGVVNMDFNWFLKNLTENPGISGKRIALTFDDGPTEFTPRFLELLEKYDQKATFFCIGKQIEKHPEIFKQTVKNRHEIGNHTFSHSNMTGFFSSSKMTEEITRNDKIILQETGISNDLYRPPFGITNPNIAKAIRKTGKKSIGWNIRSFDTAISDEKKILQRVLPKIKPGSVILLHDTSEKSLMVLEQILLFLKKEDYQSVSVSQLFNLKK